MIINCYIFYSFIVKFQIKPFLSMQEQENSLRAMLEVMTKFCMESPFPLQSEVGKNNHVPELMKGDNTSILSQANVDSDKYLTSLARPTTVGMNFRKSIFFQYFLFL